MSEDTPKITLEEKPTPKNHYIKNKDLYAVFVKWNKDGKPIPIPDSMASSYILLVDREFPEFGFKYFGKDFGADILGWIVQNYFLEKQFGETPFTGKGFGIQILKKRELVEGIETKNSS